MAYTTIKKPSDYFNTKLYTGNGTNGHSITGVGFQPDFVWLKNRSGATAHVLVDAIRGNNKVLYSNGDGAEATTLADKDFRSFDSDGFTVDANNDFGSTNLNGANIVSWNWLASNTTASNTDGSITSTVSANTTSGFSIVSYTGSTGNNTVGHGLGSAPKMVIVKTRDNARNWVCYHEGMGAGNWIYLNQSYAQSPDANYWNNTSPTSSVFSVSNTNYPENNGNGEDYIAYCFAEKQGFSKFGSYTGNGNADGTFVYTGFKPAFVMFKITNTTGNWYLNDITRRSINVNSYTLFPNLSNAETTTGAYIDMLSNGFKLRDTGAAINGSGNSFIYMAFAEEPLVGDNPCTAR